MSKAFNDRLVSGPADCAMRVHEYVWSLVRQIRNPSAPVGIEYATVWPAQLEWSEFYAYVQNAYWPEEPAGEYEGASLGNPLNQFIFGNKQLYGEGDRFYATMPYVVSSTETPDYFWEAAKYQRGAITADLANQNVPMFEASQTHMMIVTPGHSFQGNSYGGYMPQPRATGWCDAGQGVWWLNQEIKFTNLANPNNVVTYPGTCGPGSVHEETGLPGTLDEVAAVWEMPFAYFVQKYNGSVDRYDKSEWLFGPLTGGGYPQRKQADSIQRLLINPFLKDFRGTGTQRSGSCFDITAVAFDYEHFYNAQYNLSPAYGTLVGQEIDVVYPSHNFTGQVNYGAATAVDTMHSGFRLGGLRVKQSNVPSSYTLAMFEGGIETKRWTINPNTSSFVFIHPSGSTSTVQFKIFTNVSLPVGGYINLEWSELYSYKPEIWDAYAYLRLCSANGAGDEGEPYAYDYDNSALMSDYYKQYGTVINVNNNEYGVGQQGTHVNANAVYESFRKQVMDWTRVMNRHQIVGYEVINEDDTYKSVLYMHKHLYGMDGDLNLEAFDGLLASPDSASNGMVFMAPSGSWTNEWIMNMSFAMYGGPLNDGPNNASEWKPGNYGDWVGYTQRCHLMNPNIKPNRNSELFSFFAGVSDFQSHYVNALMVPEALSGYNYVKQTNVASTYHTDEQKIAFYKSCQIYPDPYYIEDIRVVKEGTEEIVRIKFSKRFQTVDEMASSTVPRSMTNWESTFSLRDQLYRTEENALMEYLIAKNGGLEVSGPKIGDQAERALEFMQTTTGNPHGSVLPRFYFTKLIPSPYMKFWNGDPHLPTDLPAGQYVSESYNSNKTPISCDRFIQLDTYLRAFCEGYVNSEKNPDCQDPTLDFYSAAWDYTWEDLWYSVDNGKWWNTFPASKRPDLPIGYGPLPNTGIYAEALDRLSTAINKLTKVRVPLPYRLLVQHWNYDSPIVSAQNQWCGGGCGLGARGAVFNYAPPSPSQYVSTSSWESWDVIGFEARADADWIRTCDGDGNPQFYSTRRVVKFKFEPTDPLAFNAMNQNLRDNYGREDNGFFASVRKQYHSVCATFSDNYLDSSTCYEHLPGSDFHDWPCGSDPARFAPIFTQCSNNYDYTTCMTLNDGVIDVGNPPSGDFFYLTVYGLLQPHYCSTGTMKSEDIAPVGQDEVIVKIPLV